MKCCKFLFLKEDFDSVWGGRVEKRGSISSTLQEEDQQVLCLVGHIFTTANFHWLLGCSFSNSIPKPQLIHGLLAIILLDLHKLVAIVI